MFINLTSLTSLHQPTNERNLPQRQVALHDIGHKEQQRPGWSLEALTNPDKSPAFGEMHSLGAFAMGENVVEYR